MTSPHTHHLRRTIALIVFFWAFYFVLTTFANWIGQSPDQLAMAGKRAVVCLIGLFLMGLMWLALRPFERLSTGQLVAIAFAAAVPVSIAYAGVNFTAFYIVAPLDDTRMELAKYPEHFAEPWRVILKQAIGWYFFIVAWAVLYIALIYADRARESERKVAELRAAAQTAELRALRYQVNPHFLFNTLNSLSSLVLASRYQEAERMILNMSDFFRASLTGDVSDDVLLGDEIDLQRLYLEIERVRFPERLAIAIDVPEALERARVPGLILQPLVENAIRHGVACSQDRVTIRITAETQGDLLQLTVEDDARTVGKAPNGHHVGLRNVADRLAGRFGARAHCQHGPGVDGGFRIVLTMPLVHD